MSPRQLPDDATSVALIENLRLLHQHLTQSARGASRALIYIQKGELDAAIGAISGIDVELDSAKALYGATIAHQRRRHGLRNVRTRA